MTIKPRKVKVPKALVADDTKGKEVAMQPMDTAGIPTRVQQALILLAQEYWAFRGANPNQPHTEIVRLNTVIKDKDPAAKHTRINIEIMPFIEELNLEVAEVKTNVKGA